MDWSRLSRWTALSTLAAACKRIVAAPARGGLIVLVTALTSATGALGEAVVVDWSTLVDQHAQVFDDPYRDLRPDQLSRVVAVARLREQAKRGETIDADKLARETASLAADGIDLDRLIAQRWLVAEKRQRAATSGNKAVTGREVSLAGFVIPGPVDADGMATAYLVPERGMCSHMPPPPPNQMVRLRLTADWQPSFIYQPARVTGILSIDPTAEMVPVVDGLVAMRATFRMDVAAIETAGTMASPHTHSHIPLSAKARPSDAR